MIRDFLPISKNDMVQRGWTQCDFVFVTGDAYVDHPSFGPAILSRLLESYGYKVGIIAQPDWKDDQSITILGEPRLGFLVSGGNMDSMVNHYSVAKKKRQTDAYSPGGTMGLRPDYATVVYSNLIRKVYKNIPIVIGGIEASLRRLGHYDYWSNKVKRSILLDSQADLLSYGMGENSIVEIAEALESGIEIKDITYIAGTVYRAKSLESVYDSLELPSYQTILDSKKEFARSFYIQYCNTDPFSGKRLVERYKDTEYIVQNPPARPLTQAEMDRVYSLPYMREYHPSYEEAGGIAAIREIKFSLVSNRGCFGGCNYCALTFHQGRILQTRSHESILAEANHLIWDKDFKGYIHDVGGPTANFRHTACDKQSTKGACIHKQCLFPEPCKKLKIDHTDYLNLLRKLRTLPNVKKVFIRSGIRYDYLVMDKDETFFEELCEHHISGQLKVAPEHISDRVLELMGKPKNSVYEEFRTKYKQVNEKVCKEQYVVPYLISSHPGSTLKEAVELAEYLRDLGYMPEQVQDFYPTPSTISTCMYYTGLDPRTLEEVYVPKTPHEKAMQRALIQYRNPKNYNLVVEALTKANRTDLIGFDKNCLIRPRQLAKEKYWMKQSNTSLKKDSNKGPNKSTNKDLSKGSNKNTNKDLDSRSNKSTYKDLSKGPSKGTYKSQDSRSNRSAYKDLSKGPGKSTYKDLDSRPSKNTYKDLDSSSNKNTYKDLSKGPSKGTYKGQDSKSNKSAYKDLSKGPGKNTYKDLDSRPSKNTYKDLSKGPKKNVDKDLNQNFGRSGSTGQKGSSFKYATNNKQPGSSDSVIKNKASHSKSTRNGNKGSNKVRSRG